MRFFLIFFNKGSKHLTATLFQSLRVNRVASARASFLTTPWHPTGKEPQVIFLKQVSDSMSIQLAYRNKPHNASKVILFVCLPNHLSYRR